MVRVSASEFARNFGRYKEIAQREPVEITSHERPSGYLISAAAFEEYKRLKSARREVLHIHELPAEDTRGALPNEDGPSERSSERDPGRLIGRFRCPIPRRAS